MKSISSGLNVIEADDVWKVYKRGKTDVEALRGVSFRVREGEIVAIMGSSGCGKTTLLNIIGGLDTPTKGNIRVNEIELSSLGETKLTKFRRENIGFVFQFYNLLPSLSALENVQLPLIAQGKSKKERLEKATEFLQAVGLNDRLYHKPGELSGGEQQRVAIARAIAVQPSIILADEPTGDLDSKTGEEIMELLRQINDQGQTVIVVTHDDMIAKTTDRIIKLRDGKVIENSGS
ncbi:ABC transporter ATP-binding protein [Candidatus Borrarchaeum sp.]|uniref:ABC transporter ATP-binding protein n=1 Tax=Candidatus Borrarchaeum sp. TaxID=2846742 RepID=UPI00257B2183|nr:ABC transporter ATP-binding protein [Candidatus Borrarchaeum sp.]